MRKWIVMLVLTSILLLALAPGSVLAYTDACWGQATAAFAQMGAMGEHASQQETPRIGLQNLAVALYEDGVIDEPNLQSLGAFLVAIDPNLTVEVCE